jgi:GNAT superfamily N-acetyltransferase
MIDDVGEIRVRIESVEPSRFNDRVYVCSTQATFVATQEEKILPRHGNGRSMARRPSRDTGRVVYLQSAARPPLKVVTHEPVEIAEICLRHVKADRRVRSVDAAGATWCADVYVDPAYRQHGIRQALLCRMLRDDRARGSKCSVLTSSHTGALLYPRIGYERIGTLYMFAPTRQEAG